MLKDVHNRLRPLGIADVLDEMIELYKTNFVLLVGISAFLYVPYSLLTTGLQNPRFDVQTPSFEAFVPFLISLFIALVFYAVAAPIVTGALTYGVSERYLGRETSIGACYKRMLSPAVFLPFLGANLLVFLVGAAALLVPGIMLGAGIALTALGIDGRGAMMIPGVILILLGIPAFVIPVYVWARFVLVAPAYVLEMRGAVGSLARSWELMKGNVLKALALMVIVGVVVSIIQGIISAPLAFAVGAGQAKGAEASLVLQAINTIVTAILSTVFAPFTSIVAILLYYDMRIRKEGFDLELLARDLAASAESYDAYGTAALPEEQIPVAPHYSEEPPREEEHP